MVQFDSIYKKKELFMFINNLINFGIIYSNVCNFSSWFVSWYNFIKMFCKQEYELIEKLQFNKSIV